MKAKGFKIGNTLRATLYLSLGLLTLSGAVWLIAHYVFVESTDFGTVQSPIEPTALQIHGAMAPIFLMGLGALFPSHITRAFRSGINLKTGIFVLALLFILIATGYLLYYTGSEALRSWSSISHSIIGLLVCPILLIHIVRGRQLMRKRIE